MFVTSIDVRFLKNTNTKYIIYPNFNNPEQIYNPKEREREREKLTAPIVTILSK